MLPMSALTAALTPKCSSLIPAEWSSGFISGVKIRILEKTSINIPETSMEMLANKSTAHGGGFRAMTGATSCAVMFSTVNSHEKSVAAATIIKIRAETLPVSQQMSHNSFRDNSLCTTIVMKMA